MSESYVQGLASTDSLTNHLERQFDNKVSGDTESPHRLVIHNVDSIAASETNEYQRIDMFGAPRPGLSPALSSVIRIAQSDEVGKHRRGVPGGLRQSSGDVQTAYLFMHSFDQLWGITLASDRSYDAPYLMLRKKGMNSLENHETNWRGSTFRTPKFLQV